MTAADLDLDKLETLLKKTIENPLTSVFGLRCREVFDEEMYREAPALIAEIRQLREVNAIVCPVCVADDTIRRQLAEVTAEREALLKSQGEGRQYCESLRKSTEDARASADHRALVNADLQRKLNLAEAKLEAVKRGVSEDTSCQVCGKPIWENVHTGCPAKAGSKAGNSPI